MAECLGIQAVSVTLNVGESIELYFGYAFFMIMNPSAITSILGSLEGGNVSIIYKLNNSQIDVAKGSAWGYLKISNNNTKEVNFILHIFKSV